MADLFQHFAAGVEWLFGPQAHEHLGTISQLVAIVAAIIGLVSGLFTKMWKAISAFAHRLVSRSGPPKDEITVHTIATLQELNAVYDFDANRYEDTGSISPALFEGWWRAYSEGFVVACMRGKPVAVVGAFPVTLEWATRLKGREVTEHQLSPEIIEQGKSERLCWYLSGISCVYRRGGLDKRPIVFKLLCQAAQRWHAENKGIVRGKEIYVTSVGSTKEGQKLLQDYLRFKVATPGDEKGKEPIFERMLTADQVRNFFEKSPLCTDCLDPVLLADVAK